MKKQQLVDVKLQISGAVVLGVMLVFTLVRVAIFFSNFAFFSPLSGGEMAAAFVQGLRFDFYITALCFGPVIFLLNLPVTAKWWTKGWTALLLLELMFLTGFLVGDFIYFPKVGRHIAEEIIQLSADWGYIISYMFTQLWWALLGLCGLFALAVYFVGRYVNRFPPLPRSWVKTTTVLLGIVLFVVLGLRGHLGGGKSLGVADVYRYVSTSQGAALTLNGAFTAYQVGRKGAQEFVNDYPLEQAVANTQQFLLASSEKIVDPQYPLMRQRVNPAKAVGEKPNIFIILLEGWHPRYIDGLSHHNFGVTPVVDEMIKNGVNFTNAYAAGQRSILGFAAVLAGVPLVPGLPIFGYGLEMTAFSTLPKHFSQAGYYTFFVQSSHRDSYRMCALASYLGMQDSFGWEDMPQRLNYTGKAPFGYDHDALQFAADKITQHAGKPFMGMVFTGITHEPFTSTLPQFDKYPYDSWEHGFLNTLGFADWSIGQLLQRAKEDGWFDNTIFVLVADHTSGEPVESTLKNHFRIPLIIYAPKYFSPQTLNQVVSQLDMIPTLYNIAGISPAYTALGRDMFDASVPRAALVAEGNNLGLITSQGALRHSGTKRLDVEAATAQFDADKAEALLLSLHKAAYRLLKENRWYDPSKENSK